MLGFGPRNGHHVRLTSIIRSDGESAYNYPRVGDIWTVYKVVSILLQVCS